MLVADWLANDGPIAAALPGFEPRPQQREMAAAVARAFADERHLAVEAGTGVGKTFAYLLPAIEHAVRRRKRVVISTHTIALQEQLIEKDIPLLRRALGVEFAAELVKGRNNYLGLRRLKQASARQRSLFNAGTSLSVLHQIEDWAYQTQDGSLSDLPEPPAPDVWEKVRSESDNCLGRRCATYDVCFFQRARRRAAEAALLVVNHALLMSDLVLRRDNSSVLPDYEFAVIDEAHTLENVATEHLGVDVANSQVQYLLSGLFNDRTGKGLLAEIGDDPHRRAVVSAAAACTQFFHDLENWQRTRGRSNGRLLAANPVGNALSPALRALVEALTPLQQSLPRAEDQHELGAYLQRAGGFAVAVQGLIEQAYESHVYWVEAEGGRARRVSLCAAPLDAGPALRQLLFDRVKSVVLTSATLSTTGAAGGAPGDRARAADEHVDSAEPADDAPDPRFEYILSRVGRPPARTLQVGSPFDFESQVRIHVEAGLPEPSNGRTFVEAAARATVYFLRQTEGRAFVLFTSYQMIQEMLPLVRDDLAAEGYTILAQGESLPRTKMLARFRELPKAVIFGADSFWQGVDVVGEALSNVIIVKLPFAVPDRPTTEARIDLIRRRQGNPFNEFQLPDAILKFRQGFGRLIRSKTDRGIVVILDPRVVTKAYGRKFLASLPECPVEVSKRPW